MLEKGELSFIFLWVMNPLIILFYQNCSTGPSAHAAKSPPALEKRMASAAESHEDRTPACVRAATSQTCAQ